MGQLTEQLTNPFTLGLIAVEITFSKSHKKLADGSQWEGETKEEDFVFCLILFYTNNMQRYYFRKMPKRLSHLWNFGPIGSYFIFIFKKTINFIESSYCTSKISETALSFNILSLWSHRV